MTEYRYRPMTGRKVYLWRVEVVSIVNGGLVDRFEATDYEGEDHEVYVVVGESRSYQTKAAAERRMNRWADAGHGVTLTRSDLVTWPAPEPAEEGQ
jgi:hypothetical protein